MPITILLADDHAIVRQGIRALLSETFDMQVVGEAEDGEKAIELVSQLQPDIVIMDINMPIVDGIEATRRIKEQSSVTEVLILSMHDRFEFVHQALQNGVKGYILKASLYDELESAIRAASHGQLHQSTVIKKYLEHLVSTSGEVPTNPLDQLTNREREVLELLAQGYRNQEIADELSLSKKTVDKYRAQVMEKLNVSTPIELGRIYARYSRTSNSLL